MRIGGLQKLTLIDYPGKLSCTVFTVGCNWRCGFCQNPELVIPDRFDAQPNLSKDDFFRFLNSKKGLLDGVCLTGGEPTIYKDLPEFIKEIKSFGFLVKLDTNGSNPKMIEYLLSKGFLDYIAMDVKASKENYSKVVGVKVNLNNIQKSIDLIKNSGIDYEFRVTVVPTIIDENEIKEIGRWLFEVKLIAVQQFQNKKTLRREFKNIKPYSEEKLKKLSKILESYAEKIEIRGI